jgi:cell division septal protein FtsQ
MTAGAGKQNSRNKKGIVRRTAGATRRGVRTFGHRWISLVLGALVSYALWGILTSPEFNVSTVAIRRITPPTLAGDNSLVKIKSFTGLVGQPIFFLDPKQVTSEIARLPAVEDARLYLVLPGKAIVEMAERQPEARWIADGIVFLISREGVILGSDDGPELPITIIDDTGVSLRSGDRVDASAVQMAFLLRDLLTPAGVSITSFRYSAQEGLTVIAAAGWKARYGSANRIVGKTQELMAVLKLAQEQQIVLSEIDLQPNRSPTFRY